MLDHASHVGADLGIMDRDARKMRADRPFLFSNLKDGTGVDEIRQFIVAKGGLR
jgi:urease accessory protein